MRYYIVDNQGNVWGDYSSYGEAQTKLWQYSEDDIRLNELEIIEGQ